MASRILSGVMSRTICACARPIIADITKSRRMHLRLVMTILLDLISVFPWPRTKGHETRTHTKNSDGATHNANPSKSHGSKVYAQPTATSQYHVRAMSPFAEQCKLLQF